MASKGPFSTSQLEGISRKVEWGLKKAERALPSGMLANIGFHHLSLGALPTRDVWDLMEEVKGYRGMVSKASGLEGSCLFLCSRAAMNLLLVAFRDELEDEVSGLTIQGRQIVAMMATQIGGSFITALGEASGIPTTLSEDWAATEAGDILRPLAALDTAMLKGFVIEDRVGLTLQTLTGALEGQSISVFVPFQGDLSKMVDGLQSAKSKKPSVSARVLVVDDAPFMRAVIKKFLANTPFEVVGEAGTGAEAIEGFKKLRPGVVVMDIMMPDMGGVAAVRGILEEDPNAKILMCSALASKSMVKDALAQGAKGYVVKPFKGPDLLAALEEIAGA